MGNAAFLRPASQSHLYALPWNMNQPITAAKTATKPNLVCDSSPCN